MKIFHIKIPNTNTKLLKILFIFLTISTFFLTTILFITCYKHVDKTQKTFSSKLIDFQNGWYMSDNTPVTLNPFLKNKNIKAYTEYTFYHKPSKLINVGDSICFRSLSTDVTLYIGDKKVITTPYYKNIISCKSSGSSWHFYKFKESDLNKPFKLKIKTYYNDNSCYITDMYVGDSSYYLLNYLYNQFFSILLGIVTFFSGVIFILLNIYINVTSKLQKHSLMHIGLFACFISLWILCATHIFDFFSTGPQVVQFFACAILYLLPTPLLYFILSDFKNVYTKALKLDILLSNLLLIIAYLLHFFNVKDLHESLILCHISLIACCANIIINFIKIYKNTKTNNDSKQKTYSILNSLLFYIIVCLVFADLYIFYSNISSNIGIFTKYTVLFVIIYLGVIAFQNIYNLDKEISHNNFIRELAYSDGLTKLGNRTAYQEKIELLRKNTFNYKTIGIITFDVNNLKTTNDTLGHNIGDDLIISASKIINQSFTKNCSTYRIGGDEFIVIIDSSDAQSIYKESALQFKVNIQNFNNYNDKPYVLSIAHGCAFYKKEYKKSLDEIIKISDQNMYENKKFLKNQNS